MPFELIEDIGSHGNEFGNAAFTGTALVVSTDNIGPAGLLDGTRLRTISAATNSKIQNIYDVGAGREKRIVYRLWMRVDSGDPTTMRMRIRTIGNTQGTSTDFTVTESWQLYQTSRVFTSAWVDSGFQVLFRHATAQDSGTGYYAAHSHVYIDSHYINLEPKKNYERRDENLQSQHRTRSGKNFTYKWGEITKYKFGIEFIDSREQALVNSWWDNNRNLMYVVDSGLEINSVRLTNKRLPISKYSTPDQERFEGIIELGTY